MDTAVILGAGFSNCAGLPLQDEFTDHLLSDQFEESIDIAITKAIRGFLDSVFHWDGRKNNLPSLEDIFTLIDLSANSGHNLGRKWTPKMLRALRRMLIFRVFSILDRRYANSEDIRRLLGSLIKQDIEPTAHFISLNWDIALERHLESYANLGIDYCVQGESWDGSVDQATYKVALTKVHGSSNWVYCDNCHTLYYDRYRKLSLIIKAGLIKSDFRLFDEGFVDRQFDNALGVTPRERSCRNCQASVGPHIATFSLRKSFRTHAFATTWQAAEQILTKAPKWIFVGYSLRNADYEFKHLLKTCQLKFAKAGRREKDIDVILKNDSSAGNNFYHFFGNDRVNIFQDGLADYSPR